MIDRNSPLPYYYQLKAIIQDEIETGRWPVGYQLPSEPALCERFGVSRTVVRQALNDLEHEGLIERIKGKGTFVSAPKTQEHLIGNLRGLHEDVRSRGQQLKNRILRFERVNSPAHVARRLQLHPSDSVVVLERLRFVDNQPWVYTVSYMPYSLCGDVLRFDMTDRSLYETLESELGLKLHYAERTVEAMRAGHQVGEFLSIDWSAPVLCLKSLTYLRTGQPIEYFVAWHRGDRSRFDVVLQREAIHSSRGGGPPGVVVIEPEQG